MKATVFAEDVENFGNDFLFGMILNKFLRVIFKKSYSVLSVFSVAKHCKMMRLN